MRFASTNLEEFQNVSLSDADKIYSVIDLRIEPETHEISILLAEHVLPQGRYSLFIERYTGIITYDKGVFYR